MIWVLWLFRLLVDHDLPILPSDDETFAVGNDALYEESFSWTLC